MPHYEQGDYRAEITAQGFGESSEKKTPYFFLEVEPKESLGAKQMPEQAFRREIKRYITD